MGDLITQTEFARRANVSRQTVNYWIRRDRGGIKGYLNGSMIDTDALTNAAFMEATARKRASNKPPTDPAEIDRLRGELDKAQAEIRLLTERTAARDQTIADLRAEIDRLRIELDTAHRLHAMTLAALPAPRKTFGEKIREALHIKPKTEDA